MASYLKYASQWLPAAASAYDSGSYLYRKGRKYLPAYGARMGNRTWGAAFRKGKAAYRKGRSILKKGRRRLLKGRLRKGKRRKGKGTTRMSSGAGRTIDGVGSTQDVVMFRGGGKGHKARTKTTPIWARAGYTNILGYRSQWTDNERFDINRLKNIDGNKCSYRWVQILDRAWLNDIANNSATKLGVMNTLDPTLPFWLKNTTTTIKMKNIGAHDCVINVYKMVPYGRETDIMGSECTGSTTTGLDLAFQEQDDDIIPGTTALHFEDWNADIRKIRALQRQYKITRMINKRVEPGASLGFSDSVKNYLFSKSKFDLKLSQYFSERDYRYEKGIAMYLIQVHGTEYHTEITVPSATYDTSTLTNMGSYAVNMLESSYVDVVRPTTWTGQNFATGVSLGEQTLANVTAEHQTQRNYTADTAMGV